MDLDLRVPSKPPIKTDLGGQPIKHFPLVLEGSEEAEFIATYRQSRQVLCRTTLTLTANYHPYWYTWLERSGDEWTSGFKPM